MQHTLSNLFMGLKNWPRRSLSPSVCVPVFLWIEIGCVCWWILAPNPTSCPPAALKNWRDKLWFATVLSNWFSVTTFHNRLASRYLAGSPDFDRGEKNLDREIIRIVSFWLTHTGCESLSSKTFHNTCVWQFYLFKVMQKCPHWPNRILLPNHHTFLILLQNKFSSDPPRALSTFIRTRAMAFLSSALALPFIFSSTFSSHLHQTIQMQMEAARLIGQEMASSASGGGSKPSPLSQKHKL